MGLEVDRELAPMVQAAAEIRASAGAAPPADAWAIRAEVDAGLAFLEHLLPPVEGLEEQVFSATGADGAAVPLRWIADPDSPPGPAVLYLHGGGMICGSVAAFAPVARGHVQATGVPFLAVDYRLAPEHPHPTPVEDCFAGLRWLHDNCGMLGIDPGRIAVMGESAGGGLAAAVALLARDRGLALAQQVLVYPMLDDRNTVPDPALEPFAAAWSYENNALGWEALLGEAPGGPEVSPYAAPARATDLADVAPAYVEVGALDIFRDEDIEYARRLARAAVPVELHVHPGAPHAFEMMAPESGVARRAVDDRRRVLRGL